MEIISLRIISHYIAQLTIKTHGIEITENVTNSKGVVPEELISGFISVARDMSIHNKKNDVEFVKMVYDAFLNESEQEEFLELINKQEMEKQLEYIKWLEGAIRFCERFPKLYPEMCALQEALKKFKEINNIE